MTSFTLTQSEKQKLKEEMLGHEFMKKKYDKEPEDPQLGRQGSQQRIVLGKNHDKIVSFYKNMLK